MVNELGFPFVVSDLALQSKRVILDMAARDANAPIGDTYQTVSRHRTDFFQEAASKYPKVTTHIGMGDSLGVPIVQGMELYGTDCAEDSVFQALLLRDGWNLKGKTPLSTGILRYASYMIRDTIQGRIHNQSFDIVDHQWGETTPATLDETSLAQKMINVSDLMRGAENRDNAMRLAQHAALSSIAMNVVVFDKGLCGNRAEQRGFISEITNAYTEAAPDDKQMFRGAIVGGWHSDLLDPIRGACDVLQTLELLG
jgi:hypothetical protein